MEAIFLTTGTALFAASVLTGSDGLLAVTNVVVGVGIDLIGRPPVGAISITLGLLLLLVLRNRRRHRKRLA